MMNAALDSGTASRGASAPGAAPGWTVTAAEAQPDPEWDAQVAAASGGDLVQTTAWAETCQRLGYRVDHVRLRAADATVLGGGLLQFRRVLPGVWIGAVPRGPLLFRPLPGLAERLVQEMIAAAARLRLALLVMQPPDEPVILEAMTKAGFRPGGPAIVPAATISLDLRRTDEQLLRGMKDSRRRLIRSLAKEGCEVEESDDVATLHRIYSASAERQGFPPVSLANLKAQWEVLAPRGLCRMFLTRHEGRAVAVEWFTCFAGQATLKLRGYDTSDAAPAARDAPTASLWGALQRLRQAGMHTFDLGGLDPALAEALLAGRKPPELKLGHGYFKWSFGGQVTLLPRAHFILPGALSRLAFGRVAPRLLTNRAVQRVAQRIRAAA